MCVWVRVVGSDAVSDTPLPPEPSPEPPVAPEHDVELEVGLAAFLPEGTELTTGDGAEADGPPTEADAWPADADGAWPAESADLTEADDVDDLVDPDRDVPGEAGPPEAVEAPAASEASHVGAAPEADPAPKEPPVDLAALGRIEADLGAVDVALLALDQGRYGTCTACDQPIDDALLAADPVRTTCEAHAPA